MAGSYSPWRSPTPPDPNQLDLFEQPARPVEQPMRVARLVRGDDPETSVEAARAASARGGRQRRAVLAALCGQGDAGATADRLAELTGEPPSSVSRRVGELLELGLAVDTGRVALTRYGAKARVVAATDAGCREVAA